MRHTPAILNDAADNDIACMHSVAYFGGGAAICDLHAHNLAIGCGHDIGRDIRINFRRRVGAFMNEQRRRRSLYVERRPGKPIDCDWQRTRDLTLVNRTLARTAAHAHFLERLIQHL